MRSTVSASLLGTRERADDPTGGGGGVLLIDILPRDIALCGEAASAIDRSAKGRSF
ncbi:hypothetical protein Halru_1445 [Halovivax ruber XH-70]|uniref:Uncharacterized protein n=1 Tax=Halovivax ruber (strain DSM 18193 / JCM 13892 / XH-70) TaxID=797302 RepID=L0I8X8_HALRX|nr:hypothetical protein Halru_1445 [Halovivax ruber XH-70]